MATPVTPIERAVLGLSDPQEVLGWLTRACGDLLGRPLTRVVWSSGRVAPVWQVELAGGAQVVLKARRHTAGLLERLLAATEVQRLLRARGVPLPEVVRPPVVHAGLVVTVEAPLPARRHDPERSVLTAVSATQLASLVDAAAGVTAPAALEPPAPWCDSDRSARRGELWPPPHDPVLLGPSFDAVPEAVRRLAEESAAALRSVWRSAGRVIGHDDWEAQNLRIAAGPDRVVAVYDADSLAALPKPVLVGTAAAIHLAGSSHGPAAAPADVDDFVRAYARVRRPDSLNRAAVGAAAGWVVAYNAACDHVLHQGGAGTFLDACRRYGREYLGQP